MLKFVVHLLLLGSILALSAQAFANNCEKEKKIPKLSVSVRDN
jgi:hypothetical protein